LRTISLLLEPIEDELFISYTSTKGPLTYKWRIPEFSSWSKSNIPQCRSNKIPIISSIPHFGNWPTWRDYIAEHGKSTLDPGEVWPHACEHSQRPSNWMRACAIRPTSGLSLDNHEVWHGVFPAN